MGDQSESNGHPRAKVTQEEEVEARRRWPDLKHTKEQARERWPDLDPKQLEAKRQDSLQRAIRAKEMHEMVNAETGRPVLGGRQPGAGRPRKQRLDERITELAETTKQRDVTNALFSGLYADDVKTRVRTAVEITKIQQKTADREVKEDELARRPIDELLKIAGAQFARLALQGKLPDISELLPTNGDVIDGHAEDT